MEAMKLIKYFLASLTVPEGDLWVNLSPHEPDRIISNALGQTQMGHDLLAQDYMLKKLTASLMHPDGEPGRKFWDRIYSRIYSDKVIRGKSDRDRANITSITDHSSTIEKLPDLFSKIWIVPDQVEVYQNNDVAYITNAKLKVMTESEYVDEVASRRLLVASDESNNQQLATSNLAKETMKNILLPIIEHEVNHGEHFAPLRQIFHSMILAKWYESHFKNSIIGQAYVDQNKVSTLSSSGLTRGSSLDSRLRGNDNSRQTINQIYQSYLDLFKTGVTDVIREEYDPVEQKLVTRKYFSGGFDGAELAVDQASLPSEVLNSWEKTNVLQVNVGSDQAEMYVDQSEQLQENSDQNAVKLVYQSQGSKQAINDLISWVYDHVEDDANVVQLSYVVYDEGVFSKSEYLEFLSQNFYVDSLQGLDPHRFSDFQISKRTDSKGQITYYILRGEGQSLNEFPESHKGQDKVKVYHIAYDMMGLKLMLKYGLFALPWRFYFLSENRKLKRRTGPVVAFNVPKNMIFPSSTGRSLALKAAGGSVELPKEIQAYLEQIYSQKFTQMSLSKTVESGFMMHVDPKYIDREETLRLNGLSEAKIIDASKSVSVDLEDHAMMTDESKGMSVNQYYWMLMFLYDEMEEKEILDSIFQGKWGGSLETEEDQKKYSDIVQQYESLSMKERLELIRSKKKTLHKKSWPLMKMFVIALVVSIGASFVSPNPFMMNFIVTLIIELLLWGGVFKNVAFTMNGLDLGRALSHEFLGEVFEKEERFLTTLMTTESLLKDQDFVTFLKHYNFQKYLEIDLTNSNDFKNLDRDVQNRIIDRYYEMKKVIQSYVPLKGKDFDSSFSDKILTFLRERNFFDEVGMEESKLQNMFDIDKFQHFGRFAVVLYGNEVKAVLMATDLISNDSLDESGTYKLVIDSDFRDEWGNVLFADLEYLFENVDENKALDFDPERTIYSFNLDADVTGSGFLGDSLLDDFAQLDQKTTNDNAQLESSDVGEIDLNGFVDVEMDKAMMDVETIHYRHMSRKDFFEYYNSFNKNITLNATVAFGFLMVGVAFSFNFIHLIATVGMMDLGSAVYAFVGFAGAYFFKKQYDKQVEQRNIFYRYFFKKNLEFYGHLKSMSRLSYLEFVDDFVLKSKDENHRMLEDSLARFIELDDNAQLESSDVGGIDLNNLDIQTDGAMMDMNIDSRLHGNDSFDPAMMNTSTPLSDHIQIPFLMPRIISISKFNNQTELAEFLNLDTEKQPSNESGSQDIQRFSLNFALEPDFIA